MKMTGVLALCCVCALFSLAGCGQQTRGYGNHVGDQSLSLVNDAAMQMARVYPPASTRLIVKREPRGDDLFGVGLVGKLRETGYAVVESGTPRRTAAGMATEADGLALDYVVDEYDGQVRVSVHVGKDALGRLYDFDAINNEFSPVGGWAWRRWEGEGQK